jgi:hypothetical protein
VIVVFDGVKLLDAADPAADHSVKNLAAQSSLSTVS